MKNTLLFRLRQLGLVTAAVAMLAVLIAPNSHAADGKEFKGLMVSPPTQRIELKNGQVYSGQMKVSNTTDADMNITTSVGTYTIENSNYDTPLYNTSGKYSVMPNWIKLDKSKLTIKANDSSVINYVVFTPNNPPAGSQYATIFVETDPAKQSGSGIQATSRVGMILIAHMADGKTIDKAIIQNEKIDGWQQSPAPIKSIFSVKNEGNIMTDVSYKFAIKNAITGKTEYESKDETGTVYPESSRSFNLSWDKGGIGFYNVEQTIKVNNRLHTKKVLVCTVPVWIFILIIVAIVALAAYFIVNYRMSQEVKKARKSTGSKTTRKATKK